MDNFILTDSGYKRSKDIKKIDNVVNNESSHSKVNLTAEFVSNPESHTGIYTALYNVPTILHNDTKTLVVDSTGSICTKRIRDINVDDWLAFKWINTNQYSTLIFNTCIDLADYAPDSFYDDKNIYIRDDSIIDHIYEHTKINKDDLFKLLYIEPVELEYYIPTLMSYWRSYPSFNYDKEDIVFSQTFDGFKKAFTHYSNKVVLKRRLTAELFIDYLPYLLSFLTTEHKEYIGDTLNYYVVDIQTHRIHSDIRRLSMMKWKHQKYERPYTAHIECTPMLRLLTKENIPLLFNFIKNHKSLCTAFIDLYSEYNKPIVGLSLESALILKEMFLLYAKKLIRIDQEYGQKQGLTYTVQLVEDDFHLLESNYIIEDDWYYTRVIGVVDLREDFNISNCMFSEKNIQSAVCVLVE